MPYIKQEYRDVLAVGNPPQNVGELNYVITSTIIEYLRQQPKVNYEVLNGVIGVLEAAKLEFYRKIVGPYENLKIAENGDVYPPLNKVKEIEHE